MIDSWLSDSVAHWCALVCDHSVNSYLAQRLVYHIDTLTLKGSITKELLQGRHPLIPRAISVSPIAIDAYEQCARVHQGLPMNNKALQMFDNGEPIELVHQMDQEVLGALVRCGFTLSKQMIQLLNIKRESAYKISDGVGKIRQFIENCDALIEGQKIDHALKESQKATVGCSASECRGSSSDAYAGQANSLVTPIMNEASMTQPIRIHKVHKARRL